MTEISNKEKNKIIFEYIQKNKSEIHDNFRKLMNTNLYNNRESNGHNVIAGYICDKLIHYQDVYLSRVFKVKISNYYYDWDGNDYKKVVCNYTITNIYNKEIILKGCNVGISRTLDLIEQQLTNYYTEHWQYERGHYIDIC